MKKDIDIEERHLKSVKDILRKILNKNNVKVYAFGSRVKGKAKKFSDLDLAIDKNGEKDSALIRQLIDEFKESDLPFKVDVIDLNDISESFYDIIRADLTPADYF